MATAFSVIDTTIVTCLGEIMEAILKSSDWAHLQLSSGTQNTTLSAGASATDTSVSTAATIPSGSLIVIDKGGTHQECRVTTGVSGGGPYTVTFTKPLAYAHSNGVAVGVGTYAKATTTRGAQMVVDLADAAITSKTAQLGIYRTHDGTTGVDKLTRYIGWRNSVAGATSDPIHIRVSAGKEHLYLDMEGPRVGEPSPEDASMGSARRVLFIGDIVPYFAGDSVPAVVLVVPTSSTNNTQKCWVSRNQGDSSSWVEAQLLSLCVPMAARAQTLGDVATNWVNRLAAGDGKTYMGPYVVCEKTDGIRGRVAKAYFMGFRYTSDATSADSWAESAQAEFSRLSYNSETFIVLASVKCQASSSDAKTPFGLTANRGGWDSPMVAVPYS